MDNDGLKRLEDKIDKLSEKMDDKLEKHSDHLQELNLILAKNTESLIIHEKRTNIAEQKLSMLEVHLQTHIEKDEIVLANIQEKLTPIYKHVTIVNVITIYVIPALAAILGFLFKIGIFK